MSLGDGGRWPSPAGSGDLGVVVSALGPGSPGTGATHRLQRVEEAEGREKRGVPKRSHPRCLPAA